MAERDITVNINGNGSGGSGTPPSPTPGVEGVGDDARLTASVSELVTEIRNALARGNGPGVGESGFKGYLNDVGRSIVTQRQEEIRSRFDLTREQNYTKWSDEVSKLDAEREARAARYSFDARGQLWNPDGNQVPLGTTVSQDLDRWYNPRRQQIDANFAGIDERLASEEETERLSVEREMTDALRSVAEALRNESREKSSGGEDSYIGKLRLQRKELTDDMERAVSQDDYIAARKRLQEFDQRQSAAGNGDIFESVTNARLATSGAGMITSAASGSMTGVGIGAVGLGAALAGVPLVGIIVGAIVAAIGHAINATVDRIESMSDIASVRGIWNGNTGNAALRNATATVINARTNGYYGEEITRRQLGLEDAEFMNRALALMTTSGVLSNWENRTFYSYANESQFNLREGSIASASRYDRYGAESNEAVARLAYELERLNDQGINTGIGGDLGYIRMQERFDVQQQLMGRYYSIYNRPDYNVANATQAAYSAAMDPRFIQDGRIGDVIAKLDAALGNPQSENMQAISFDALREYGAEFGLDKMNNFQLQYVMSNPQSFGLNETQINSMVIRRVADMAGVKESDRGNMDALFGNMAFMNIIRGILPNLSYEELAQTIPGLATGKTVQAFRQSRQAMSEGAGAAHAGILQNVTDYSQFRTAIGKVISAAEEFTTQLGSAIAGYNVEENEVHPGS